MRLAQGQISKALHYSSAKSCPDTPSACPSTPSASALHLHISPHPVNLTKSHLQILLYSATDTTHAISDTAQTVAHVPQART